MKAEWVHKKLGELVVDSYAGGTPNRGREDYFGGDIPWVSSGEVNNPIITSTIEKITLDGLNNSSARWIPENSILLALYGATAGQVSMLKIKATANQAVLAIIPNDQEVDTDFLYYQIVNNKQKLLFLAQGSGQPNLSKNIVDRLPISYPTSLPAQRRIAAILSSADKVIATTQKVIAKYKQMKLGMMENLLKPKEGWKMVRLGEVALIVRGGSPRPIDSYITTEENGINWIKIGDIDVNGKYVEKTSEKILSEGKLYSREVHNGDFILSNSMSFGRPYIVKIDGCIHDGWLAIQNYEHVFDTDFLFYVLSSDMVKSQYSSMASGSTVLNLNKEKVAQVTIAVPSIVEQRRISKILSGIDKKIEAEQAILNKYTLIKKGLMEKLLNEKK